MNKHDTVIGYIEYLDCNGCVRERIPYKALQGLHVPFLCGIRPARLYLFPDSREIKYDL